MARRTRGGNREPVRPRPVEKVELSEKHPKLRLALVLLLAAVGCAGIGLGVSFLFGTEAGWQEIQVSTGEIHCGGDFTFLYCLGEGERSPSEEKRGLTALYSQAATTAYRAFTKDEEFEGLGNVAALNRNPNREMEVDEYLYRALAQMQEAGDRSLFLGPVYARYDDLFTCTDDWQTVDFDPYSNPEVAEEYEEMAAWARNAEAIDLELLGGNRVKLKVSEEYLSWAKENGVTAFVDFAWMKNAFILDSLAEQLTAGGYTHGCISSFDGYVRCLDDGENSYSLPVYDRVGDKVYQGAVMAYTGPVSLVYLRLYPMSQRDEERYYRYQNGDIRSFYVDLADGKARGVRNDLICYSREKSCGEVLLSMLPTWFSQDFGDEAANALLQEGLYPVYCQDKAVRYWDTEIEMNQLYKDDAVTYRAKLEE